MQNDAANKDLLEGHLDCRVGLTLDSEHQNTAPWVCASVMTIGPQKIENKINLAEVGQMKIPSNLSRINCLLVWALGYDLFSTGVNVIQKFQSKVITLL